MKSANCFVKCQLKLLVNCSSTCCATCCPVKQTYYCFSFSVCVCEFIKSIAYSTAMNNDFQANWLSIDPEKVNWHQKTLFGNSGRIDQNCNGCQLHSSINHSIPFCNHGVHSNIHKRTLLRWLHNCLLDLWWDCHTVLKFTHLQALHFLIMFIIICAIAISAARWNLCNVVSSMSFSSFIEFPPFKGFWIESIARLTRVFISASAGLLQCFQHELTKDPCCCNCCDQFATWQNDGSMWMQSPCP